MAEIDAGHGDAPVADEGERLEEGAVAAQREKELRVGGEVFPGSEILTVADQRGTFFAQTPLDGFHTGLPVAIVQSNFHNWCQNY